MSLGVRVLRMNPETNHCRSVYGITNKGGKGHVVLKSSSDNHSHPQPMFIIFGTSYLMFIPGPQLGLLRSCLGTGTTAGLVVLGSQHVAASSRDQQRGHPGIIPRISGNMLYKMCIYIYIYMCIYYYIYIRQSLSPA